MKKELFSYRGSVMSFNKVINNRWFGQTYAVSEKQAKSNLIYQYKKQAGFIPSAKITLSGTPVKGYIATNIITK